MSFSNNEDLYLVLDQGGHSSRALVFGSSGACVFTAREPIATKRMSGFRIEHDASELAQSLLRCCHAVCEELGGDVQKVRAAGMASQRSSIVCWEKDTGNPLTPVLSWQDRRAWEFVESLSEKAEDIRDTTGLVLSPHYGASKLRWCLRQDPAVKRARLSNNLVVGPLASFLIRHLVDPENTDDFCDPANASRTQLWSRHQCDWSPELCELFDIDMALLPRSVPSEYAYGNLELGTHAVPLKIVTGDQSAVVYAFGEPEKNTAYINLGTGAFIQWPVGRKPVDIPGILNSVVFQDDKGPEYVLEGTINGAGSALTWLAEKLGAVSKALVSKGVAEALKEPPPIFLNGIGGLGSPYWISDFESEFLSDSLVETSDGLKAVAILESIAFLIAENLARIQTSRKEIKHIVLTGGLSSVDYLCQAIADACGVCVQRSDVKEATATGVAFLVRRNISDRNSPLGRLDFSRSKNLDSTGDVQFNPDTESAIFLRYQRWSEEMEKRSKV